MAKALTASKPSLPAVRPEGVLFGKICGIALICLAFAPTKFSASHIPSPYLSSDLTENFWHNVMVFFSFVSGLVVLGVSLIKNADRRVWFTLIGGAPFFLWLSYTFLGAQMYYQVSWPFPHASALVNVPAGFIGLACVIALATACRMRLKANHWRGWRLVTLISGLVIMTLGVVAFSFGNTPLCYLLFGSGTNTSPDTAQTFLPEARFFISMLPEILALTALLSLLRRFSGTLLLKLSLALTIIFFVFPLVSSIFQVIIYFRMSFLENEALVKSLNSFFSMGRAELLLLICWKGMTLSVTHQNDAKG